MIIRQLCNALIVLAILVPAAQADTLMVFRVSSGMGGAADGEASTVSLWSSSERMTRR